jgi:hypothetical protein
MAIMTSVLAMMDVATATLAAVKAMKAHLKRTCRASSSGSEPGSSAEPKPAKRSGQPNPAKRLGQADTVFINITLRHVGHGA